MLCEKKLIEVKFKDENLEVTLSQLSNVIEKDVFVKSNLNGKPMYYSLHRHLPVFKEVISKGLPIIRENHKNYIFSTLITAKDIVSDDVLDYVMNLLLEQNINVPIEGLMSIVTNPYTLEWFLKKGIKTKAVKGYGDSTLEWFIYRYESNTPDSRKCIDLLRKYNAIDYNFLKVAEEKSLYKKSTIDYLKKPYSKDESVW